MTTKVKAVQIELDDTGGFYTATNLEAALQEAGPVLATGLVAADIGVTVQGYDADTAKYDAVTANFTGTLQEGGSNVLTASDIGTTVQGYDANTAKLNAATSNFTGNLQEGGVNVLIATDIGATVQGYDVDTLKADTADTLTAGFDATSYSGGTISSGTYAVSAANGNFQHITNGGAFTLGVPGSVCTVVVEITNNGSAGAITTSGYTDVDGDAFTTTNTHKFLCYITKSQNYSALTVRALQ